MDDHGLVLHEQINPTENTPQTLALFHLTQVLLGRCRHAGAISVQEQNDKAEVKRLFTGGDKALK